VEHVVLQEVHTHSERPRRLPLGERQPAVPERALLLGSRLGFDRDERAGTPDRERKTRE
jgi:hypothetical protein